MPIDPKKALGAKLEPVESSWNDDKLILYALGVGVGVGQSQVDPKVLQYTYENVLKPLPTYGVIPMFAAVGGLFNVPGLEFNPMMLLHGEQYTEIIEPPLPTEAQIVTEGQISGIYDKGKGALITIDYITKEKRTGKPLIKNVMGVFIRGEGGFGGDAKSPEVGNVPPDRQPDAVVEYKTLTQQALIYRLSGDYNPLHADPGYAQKAGFKMPILHGRCTFSVAGHALLKACCGYDERKLKSMEGRFSSPVYPGETIRTEMWVDGAIVSFRSSVPARGVTVLNNGRAEIA